MLSDLKNINIYTINLENPKFLYLIIPLVVVLLFLIIINFVKFSKEERRSKIAYKIWLFLSRGIIISLLVLALTSPYYLRSEQSSGNPTITLLVDNSSSMELFDIDVGKLKSSLEKKIPVNLDIIGSGTNSRIGDGIFRHLHEKNIFVLTDGNNDKESISLRDIIPFATKFNSSINILKIKEKKEDVSVSIIGPRTTIIGTSYNFGIKLRNAKKPVRIVVSIDGTEIYNKETTEETIKLTKKFNSLGDHQITAKIINNDHFKNNNIFYKIVNVVDKPKVLYLSDKDSIIGNMLSSRYKVSKVNSIPKNINDYFMVVINDRMHKISEEEGKILESFTDNGDGLVVIGGRNSFKGNSNIDLLLPLKLGEMEETGVDFNYIFVIDSSGIIDQQLTDRELTAIELLKVFGSRKENINVAMVDFSFKSNLIVPFTPIDNINEIYNQLKDYQDVTTFMGKLWVRPALINLGLQNALETIGDKQGNNNIVLVSYGHGFMEQWIKESYETIDQSKDKSIRVHSLIVPHDFLEYSIGANVLKKISSRGRGMFMESPREISNLFEKKLIIANTEHYITANLKLNAKVSGHNNVVPTASALTLVTTGTGVPIITSNNYNKVTVISTDDGDIWATDLYEGKNLKAIFRIFDWGVGELNRKKDTYVDIKDARINKTTIVRYKGTKPQTAKCEFYSKKELFECRYTPKSTGIDSILNKKFDVNYDPEYELIGFKEHELTKIAEETGGAMLNLDNTEAIIQTAKEKATVQINKKIYIDWYIVILVIVLLLFEILIRRIKQKLKKD